MSVTYVDPFANIALTDLARTKAYQQYSDSELLALILWELQNGGGGGGGGGGSSTNTPTESIATTSGTVPAGARFVEFIFSTDFQGTVNGQPYDGSVDEARFYEMLPSGAYAAIPYTVTAGSIHITRTIAS